MSMTINTGMLIFCFLDACIAFFLVFFVVRSKFGGPRKTFARLMASILGILVFILYFSTLLWFNMCPQTLSEGEKTMVYAAPFVLSALTIALAYLSRPLKKDDEDEKKKEDEDNDDESEDSEEHDSQE